MDNQILAHTKYNCTYHIVFIPKFRRKVMYGKIGKEVGEILSTVCKITGVELIKGGVCPNHVHLYVSIPPKMSVSEVMSKLKGGYHIMDGKDLRNCHEIKFNFCIDVVNQMCCT